MLFQIELTPESLDDLATLRPFDRRRVVAEIETHLSREPANPTRNRKRLRPNALAEWELRVDEYRIFYDVLADAGVVKVVAIGYKKGSDLFIHGEKYEL